MHTGNAIAANVREGFPALHASHSLCPEIVFTLNLA